MVHFGKVNGESWYKWIIDAKFPNEPLLLS